MRKIVAHKAQANKGFPGLDSTESSTMCIPRIVIRLAAVRVGGSHAGDDGLG